MGEVNVVCPVDVRPDAVWNVLSDFAGFLNWAGEGEIRIEGHGVGMIRHLRMAIGEMGERLIELDEQRHAISYALAYGQPLGMQEYLVLVQVFAGAEQGAEIHWHGQFEPMPDADEAQIAVQLTAVYESMSAALSAYIRQRT